MKLALVLPGGGARAAYQVGVLKYLTEHFQDNFRPTIFCGTSAGAINVIHLAQYVDNLPEGVAKLEDLWSGLKVNDIFDVPDINLPKLGVKLAYDAMRGQFWKNLQEFQALFDTLPLANLLRRWSDLEKVHRLVDDKVIDAITVTTTEYGTGKAVIFIDSHKKDLHWSRVQRETRNVKMSVRHIVASAAIPLIFPAIKIDGVFHGDGSMRDKSPFSPPAKLGADKIFAIGLNSLNEFAASQATLYPSIASIGSTLADSIFIDALDADYENLSRINKILRQNSLPGYKAIDAFFMRPTRDLGAAAPRHIKEIPRTIRRVLQALGSSDESSSDFLSYLLFAGGYAQDLIRMGYEDCRRQHDKLAHFLNSKSQFEVA